jgi:4,5-DOPA dioxygenase extradiol
MNAIADNAYTRTLNALGKRLPRPKAVLCVSAHWMTEGTWVTAMPKPKTIHDFYGFPEELFAVQYPAPGSPETAEFISGNCGDAKINLDREMWGLDHGTWSVLRHLYPAADIPVLQMSLHMEKPASYHFELGRKMRGLRDHGILIVGSGNVVHNLRRIQWDPKAPPFPWAVQFDGWLKERLEKREFEPAIEPIAAIGEPAQMSIPTWEHYFPMHYVLGASTPEEALRFEYEGLENGSISMRSFSFGA